MPKSSEKGSQRDPDSALFTRERMKRAMPFSALSPALQKALTHDASQPDQSTQEVVAIRLSKDVAEALRASGSGWQRRVDEHLREWLPAAPPEFEKAS